MSRKGGVRVLQREVAHRLLRSRRLGIAGFGGKQTAAAPLEWAWTKRLGKDVSVAFTAVLGVITRRPAGHRFWTSIALLLALVPATLWIARPVLRADISPERIQAFGDLPHVVPLSAPFLYVIHGDGAGYWERSALVLYENGTRLGPAHAHHDRIRDVGRGAYSHWGRGLIFSSSDNSDPRTNGRVYSIEAPAALNPSVLWPALVMIAAAGSMALRHWWQRKSAVWLAYAASGADRLRRWVLRACAACLAYAATGPAKLRHRWHHPKSAVWLAASRAWAWLGRPLNSRMARRFGVSPLVIGLCLAATSMIAAVARFGASERSAWILMTAPDPYAAVNSSRAYSEFVGGTPIHHENLWFLRHLAMFSGGETASDFYALRPVYAYLASALVPILGWIPAMAFANLIGWAAAILLVHAFSLKATGERSAAFWACLFSIGGMGFVSHVHDYSAHLLAFTFYFAAVYLVHASEVWRAAQPWRVHAGLGSFLALASLEYHTGLVALLGYALAAARHNRLLRIAAVCAGVYACTLLWPHMLNWLSGSTVDYGAYERSFLKTAVDRWIGVLLADPASLLRLYADTVLRLLSYEMPLMVVFGAAGLAGLVLARRSLDFAIFVAAFFAVPILALAAYTGPDLVSRGYIGYQTSIFVYSGAGYLLHRLAEQGRRGPALAGMLGGGLLAAALAWNLAYLAGVVGPLKIYFLGIGPYWAGLTETLSQIARVPEVVSLTGAEPTPRLFFGSATLADAGFVPCDLPVTHVAAPEGHYARALVVRAPFLLLMIGAVLFAPTLCLGRSQVRGRPYRLAARTGWLVGGLALVAYVAPLLNYSLRSDAFPVPCGHQFGIVGRQLRYEVDVSPRFLARLDTLPAEVAEVEVLQGFSAPSQNPAFRVRLVGDGLEAEFRGSWLTRVERRALVEALHRTPRLAVEVAQDAAGFIAALDFGWQRNGLPGRRLILDGRVVGAAEQPVLPTLEIRARRPDGLFLPELTGF